MNPDDNNQTEEKDLQEEHTFEGTDSLNAPLGQSAAAPKSKKKAVITLVGIVLLALIGLAVYYFMFSSKETEPTTTETTTTETKEEAHEHLTYATPQKVYTLNEEDKLEVTSELAADEQYIDVTSDGKTVLLYKGAKTDDTGFVINSIWKRVDGQDTKLVDVPNSSVDSIYAGTLSPNGSELSYFETQEGESASGPLTYNIGAINVETGEKTTWHTVKPNRLLTSQQWLNDNTMIASQATCFQCDGPAKGILWKIERDSEEPTRIADLTDGNSMIYGNGFTVDTTNQTIYASTTDNFNLGVDYNQISNSTTSYFKITASDNSVEKMYTAKGVYSNLLNLSSEGKSLIVKEEKAVKGTDGESDELDVPTIKLVSTESGQATDIPFEVAQTKEDYPYLSLAAYSDTENVLYFSMQTTPNSDTSKVHSMLYALPVSGEETTITTLLDETLPADNAYPTELSLHSETHGSEAMRPALSF